MRDSDRWITPGVLMTGIFAAAVVVLGITAGMVYLSSIGQDPDPVLRLIGEFTTAISAFGALVLQLWNRVTTTKVETAAGKADKRTEVIQEDVAYIASVLEPGRHSYPETTFTPGARPPVPDSGTALQRTGD